MNADTDVHGRNNTKEIVFCQLDKCDFSTIAVIEPVCARNISARCEKIHRDPAREPVPVHAVRLSEELPRTVGRALVNTRHRVVADTVREDLFELSRFGGGECNLIFAQAYGLQPAFQNIVFQWLAGDHSWRRERGI